MTENYYEQCGEYTQLFIESEKHGTLVFLIDNDDVENTKKYKWIISKVKNMKNNSCFKYYALASNNKKSLLLHRFIINAPPNKIVDHINRNTFDTRKKNLRITSRSINGFNSKSNRNNKSGRKGVKWIEDKNRWMAYITKNNKRKHLGLFTDINDAIKARESAESEYYGKMI